MLTDLTPPSKDIVRQTGLQRKIQQSSMSLIEISIGIG
jgi:hypothetical protein